MSTSALMTDATTRSVPTRYLVPSDTKRPRTRTADGEGGTAAGEAGSEPGASGCGIVTLSFAGGRRRLGPSRLEI
jgi:hypothetical protein